jgi:DNA-binding MarR family transcriptional regulator
MPSSAQANLDLPVEAPSLDLERFVPYRLSVLSNRVSNAIARHYSERFGLTVYEWRVMAVLGGTPELSAREVALRTEMDKVQVSRAVAGLVRMKLLSKNADDADGRITRLNLSSRGQAIYNEIVPVALHLEELFLEALTPSERVELDRLIGKLSRQARLLGAVVGNRPSE